MNKLLIICGQTATGKTGLALQLAKQFDGELISADSRQVYKGMDIGTGKDIPIDFIAKSSKLTANNFPIRYFENSFTRIWGYNLVEPTQPFSVGQYVKIATQIITAIHERNKLPIMVGGTGQYIDSVISPPATINIPPNQLLRRKLEELSTVRLQENLQHLDPKKWHRMNFSDQHNPRRLVRAIEVAQFEIRNSKLSARNLQPQADTLWLGLKLPKEVLAERIRSRVEQRLTQGMTDEVARLQFNSLANDLPASATIGYRQIQAYLDGEIDLEQAKAAWVLKEMQYAKRQMTWFKKNPHIHWFDTQPNSKQTSIVGLVEAWYSEKNYEKN